MLAAMLCCVAYVVAQTPPATQPAPAQPPRQVAEEMLSQMQRQGAQPTTQATTQPGRQTAEQMLSQMLRPTTQTARPLQPVADGGGGIVNHNIVAPGAPQVRLLGEGTIITDRVGRLTRSDDGKSWTFNFESDGRAMVDPPVGILPNRTLTKMVNAVTNNSADLRFRISGEVTEFDNRNFILIQKAAQVQEMTVPLR